MGVGEADNTQGPNRRREKEGFQALSHRDKGPEERWQVCVCVCVCVVKVPLEARRFGSPETAVTGGFELANTDARSGGRRAAVWGQFSYTFTQVWGMEFRSSGLHSK